MFGARRGKHRVDSGMVVFDACLKWGLIHSTFFDLDIIIQLDTSNGLMSMRRYATSLIFHIVVAHTSYPPDADEAPIFPSSCTPPVRRV